MRRAALFLFVTISVVPRTGAGQEPLPLLSAEVSLGDFGITAPTDVLRGRVSVVHAPEGPSLAVHFLRETALPVAARRAVHEVSGGPEPGAKSVLAERVFEEGVDASSESRAGAGGSAAPPGRPSDRRDRASEPLEAVWLWRTRLLLDEPSERARFLAFVEGRGIDRVFMYLPAERGARPDAGFIPFDGREVGALVADLRALGTLTYALDGDPAYVYPENHEGVVRTVRAVMAHNRTAPPQERFLGIRYDIEPYLLPGFQGPRRGEILDGFVRLAALVSAEAKAGELRFGLDIPFWLDGPDEETGQPLDAVLDGRRDTLLGHALSLVDDIAIMDYRTDSSGPNGSVALATGELALAREHGVGVFVGVETVPLLDEDLFTFRGIGEPGLPGRGDGRWVVLESRAEGRVRLWMVDGADALVAVRKRTAESDVRYWAAGNPTRVEADRQSFHALGRPVFHAETNTLRAVLRQEPAFLGLALHDYLGVRDLLEGGR